MELFNNSFIAMMLTLSPIVIIRLSLLENSAVINEAMYSLQRNRLFFTTLYLHKE
jgi:hypothetical protein